MADDGGPDLEQAVQDGENAPQPTSGQKTAGAGAAPATAGAENGGDSLLRSAYVARTAAAPEASAAGDFSQMDTADGGVLLRGAYLKHLSGAKGESAGEHEHVGEDMVRRAYVARIASVPPPQRAGVARTKRKASAAGKAAAKKRPARAAPAKAKPRAQGKARGRRGKRPRR